MRRLKRFAQLAPSERRLLMRVLLVVGVARTSLWVMPVEAARRAVSRASAGAVGNSVEQVVWAVKAVSRYLPGATCLTPGHCRPGPANPFRFSVASGNWRRKRQKR